MQVNNDDPPRIALSDASERLAGAAEPFVILFERGEFSVELYAPKGTDTQQPHDQDEAYIVAAGNGIFRRVEERVPFTRGDFLFVTAGVPHVFEQFTDDFQTWVIFFGPKGGSGPARSTGGAMLMLTDGLHDLDADIVRCAVASPAGSRPPI